MTGTLLQTIGGVPANATLAISALSSASRTISFTCSAANSSGSLSGVKVRFYKHRLPDAIQGTTITNQVRHFAMQGRGFVSVMDADSEWIGGLRRRDRFQGHRHDSSTTASNNTGFGNGWGVTTAEVYIPSGVKVELPISDGTNGTPRTGKTTDARGISAFPYVFAKRVL
ncbi:hypothetical protein LEP1GSC194_3481 [Leptospira alstonii serovar Sichuan str. 79601]|nr:hypothetical protein LEP1GSC194_3481 [Leptospira alstonii serovar Sichuan str. 79601]